MGLFPSEDGNTKKHEKQSFDLIQLILEKEFF
jgi:hypothetical protein